MISSVIQVRAGFQRHKVARGSLFSDLTYTHPNPSPAKRRLYCSAGPVEVGWMASISPHPGPLPRERESFGPGPLPGERESFGPGRLPREGGSCRLGRFQRDSESCRPGRRQRDRGSCYPGPLPRERESFGPESIQREGGSCRLSSRGMQQTERPRMPRGTMRRSQAKGKEFRKGLRGGAA